MSPIRQCRRQGLILCTRKVSLSNRTPEYEDMGVFRQVTIISYYWRAATEYTEAEHRHD